VARIFANRAVPRTGARNGQYSLMNG
jgi:hypothetical protein